MTAAADFAPGRPLVFRNATVLTLNDAHDVLSGADVLVSGEQIAAVGAQLAVPEGTAEVDAAGGIVMPGMIDTHRHMWQTAMRGYGADWTLTQYFVWYYLQWGKTFRPQDIYAGNLLAALEAIDAGVTTTVDWSHGLQTVDHAEAAVDALTEVPGRFVLAYGNIQQGPWEWSAAPEFRDFVSRRFGSASDMLGFQMAFDVTGDPAFPEKAAFEVARDLGVPVTTHAGVWGATNDDGIRLMHEHGFMTPSTIYVHAATLTRDSYHRIAATGGSASVSTESEQSAGQGYPPTWQLREHAIPVSLSMDTSVWWSGDLFSAMRTTLGADRSREHLEAHNRQETITHCHLRAEDVVDWATRGGARALGLDSVTGSLEPGLTGDVPGAQPVRARGVPGPARRRAHRRHQRPRRQARSPAHRHHSGQGPGRDRADRRVPAGPAGPAGLGRRHAPGYPGDQGAGQPLHLHQVGRGLSPVERRQPARQPGLTTHELSAQ
jgi:cytosine/adenosine deaminase-related metal-dependent hydrolase